jgi:UPF0755 protein
MSETFLSDVVDDVPQGSRRRSQRAAVKRRRRRRRRTWVSVLVVLAVVVGGTFGAWRYGLQPLLASINEPDDYAGPGTGQATVKIPSGASGSAIGTLLKDAGVVKSGKAFVTAYNANSQASGIQAGTYRLRQQMSAAAAVQALIDTEARLTTKVTLREGLRVTQIVDQLAKDTKIPRERFAAALKDPESLGLPASAKGVAEGYLFPATYDIEPDETATQILARLVQRTAEALEEAGVPEARHREVLTKASLVQAEAGRPEDFPKVARVVENRLGIKMKLQFDTTVHYATKKFRLFTSSEDLKVKSPYNTYIVPGLPVGPINNPGSAAIDAVMRPAAGNWIYFVTTDPDTGLTKFTNSAAQFAAYTQEFREWQKRNPGQ